MCYRHVCELLELQCVCKKSTWGERMIGGARYRQHFSPFSVNNSFSMKKTRKSTQKLTKFFFPILHVFTNFHHKQNNIQEKNGSTITTVSHDNTMSAEKPLS